jgi:hypothetical protein
MTRRQITPLLLLAAIVAVGGGRREGATCGPATACLIPTLRGPENAPEIAALSSPTAGRIVASAPVIQRAASPLTEILSGENAALLAEQLNVQRLLQGVELDLTHEQWTTLAAVTGHYQTVRQAFEATIATVAGTDALRLEIPAYPVAGDALREKFFGELRERLGEATGQLIAERAGASLEGYFGGFGVGVQTLDFTANAAAQADYQVTRTARFWNSAETRESLTLRRETFFPGLEDPTGERWGALLALLVGRGAAKAGS